ncbi:hypothetical protein B0H14DRAFT_2396096 [Mycena olivaceomarginata]|nr:hypothetical protein B0H14DRAFT_2396096 [Mycena olivaceomarginata]
MPHQCTDLVRGRTKVESQKWTLAHTTRLLWRCGHGSRKLRDLNKLQRICRGKHRPKQVTAWIGGRRTARPDVADPVEYTAQWQMWWDSLQPAWRRRESDGTWSTTGGYGEGGQEWGPLYQWGVNGILSLVASLYFWGCAVYEQVELQTQWEQAISNVVWMLEGMATYYEKFGKKF